MVPGNSLNELIAAVAGGSAGGIESIDELVQRQALDRERMQPTPVREPGTGNVGGGSSSGSVTVQGAVTPGKSMLDLGAALTGMSAEDAETMLRYQNTQTNRWQGNDRLSGVARFGQDVYNAIQEKRLRDDVAGITEAQGEKENAQKMARYVDGKQVLEATFANNPDMSPERIEALARQYMNGEVDLKEILPDAPTRLELAENARKVRQGKLDERDALIANANIIRDDVADDLELYRAAEANLQNYEATMTAIRSGDLGAADVKILYDFISGLDPESVVREGEIALVQSAIPLVENIKAWAEKNLDPEGNAGFLPDSMREQIMNVIHVMNEGYMTSASERMYGIADLAESNSVPLDMVIPKRDIDRFNQWQSGERTGPSAMPREATRDQPAGPGANEPGSTADLEAQVFGSEEDTDAQGRTKGRRGYR